MSLLQEELVPLCWLRHAQQQPHAEAIVHWTFAGPPRRWSWAELVRRAQQYQTWLQQTGVRPGQVCALIVRHHPEFYPLYMGVSLAGAIPAVLAYPSVRLHPDKFRMGLEGMARVSGLEWVLTETELKPVVQSLTSTPGSTVKGILCPPGEGVLSSIPAAPLPAGQNDPDSPCLLQHSSGTTGLQKGVMLSHRAVLEHIKRYGQAICVTRQDKVVSWLPLYHDMGFIACFHQSLALGIPLVQLDPMEWVAAPYLLLEAISREKGTLTWLPNFAYNLMAARVQDEDLEGIGLDSLRLVINCSEPIRADSHNRFQERFAPHGLNRAGLATCYAMAETTFAVSQTPPGQVPRVVLADRSELVRGRFQEARGNSMQEVRSCVSSGKTISGCQVRVIGEVGNQLPEGQVGELLIRSASLFSGYRNQPRKTAEAFLDGWYRSGDFGFQLGEDLFVIGRKKDLIIVAGKNICPEDVEDAAGSVPGVIPGRVVAFGVDRDEMGTEEIHVVAETEIEDAGKRRALCVLVQQAGIEVDVTISRVHLVAPRWLIKSSSGKISRSANKERILGLLHEGRRAA